MLWWTLLFNCADIDKHGVESMLTKSASDVAVGHGKSDDRTRHMVWTYIDTHQFTHTSLTALCLGLPGWAGTRKVKPNWILLKQETVSGSGISWAICKSAPCSRQITMPAPHHSVFYRPDALPATQPTASKHWRHYIHRYIHSNLCSTKNCENESEALAQDD